MNPIFFNYTAYLESYQTVRVVNLNVCGDFLYQKNAAGKIVSVQCLTNMPTNLEWVSVPEQAKADKTGKVLVDRKGNQQITFSKKQEQKHVMITIIAEEDIQRLSVILGVDTSGMIFASLEEIFGEGFDVTTEVISEPITQIAIDPVAID